jgi:hypothetical protein
MMETIRDQYAMAALNGLLGNPQIMAELGVAQLSGMKVPTPANMAVRIAGEVVAAACERWGHLDRTAPDAEPGNYAKVCDRCGRRTGPQQVPAVRVPT